MSNARLVYSSDGSHKKICGKCGELPCVCTQPELVNPHGTTIKMRLETHGRGGKAVTIVFELPRNEEFCLAEAKRLKSLCSSGGTFKDGRIEIQGDHRAKVKAYFESKGFKVKLAGG